MDFIFLTTSMRLVAHGRPGSCQTASALTWICFSSFASSLSICSPPPPPSPSSVFTSAAVSANPRSLSSCVKEMFERHGWEPSWQFEPVMIARTENRGAARMDGGSVWTKELRQRRAVCEGSIQQGWRRERHTEIARYAVSLGQKQRKLRAASAKARHVQGSP